MAKATERVLLIATTSFVGSSPDGSGFYARAGETIVWSDHPAVKKYAEWFKPVVPTYESEPVIEQATAAPGEKRG